MALAPLVSFIIPAKNEEKMLTKTLASIHNTVRNTFTYEIIVVDNGSTDSTSEIAKSHKAMVIYQDLGTIGALRNAAAKVAKGKCFVFIDADVSITHEWLSEFERIMPSFLTGERIITGSRCLPDKDASWIARAWFRRPPNKQIATHMGSGHMIIGKTFFEDIRGFDEQITTGEDYDFCMRAKTKGGTIIENRELKAIHYGTPDCIPEFIAREIWHGSGDTQSLSSIIKSKVAILSIIFAFAHMWLILSLALEPNNLPPAIIPIATIIIITVAATAARYYYVGPIVFIQNLFLYYLYFWARFFSIFRRILHIKPSRSPRAGRKKSPP